MKEVFQTIYSPCYGSIKEVFVQPSAYVYEWEKLLLIETHDQEEIEISVGISGDIVSLEVAPGQMVTPASALTVVRDDLQITGSD
ncbi:hypothetical protein [Halobacillus sp. BBL2006]|uniref:hypothetical protein n=1 Tax=Halobacillus sp. BBL2006 TaxID=1543706 RepID=UPI000541FC20|nr:hypothetical protein [Halobacillus sp. BBL2006]KHE71535.1 hypothetical protein LD39_09295 [Halobacillus sp. BBL2006]